MAERLFPYVTDGRDLKTGASKKPWQDQTLEMLTASELQEKFNEDKRLQRQFKTADNYLNYMNEFMDLVDANPGQFNWWDSMVPHGTSTYEYAQQFDIHEEDARMGSGVRIDTSKQAATTTRERYEALAASPEMSALINKYSLQPSYSTGGDQYAFNGINSSEIYEDDDTFGSKFTTAMDIANRVFLGWATGQAGTALMGVGAGTSGAAAGSGAGAGAGIGSQVGGAILGNAINQGLTTGRLDVGQLATAGLAGYVESVASGLADGTLSGTAYDNAVWDLSGTLGLPYEETLNIVTGVARGAVSGGDLESILTGAVSGYTAGQVKNLASDFFGSEIDIDNLFDEGTTTIPTSALNPIIDTTVEAAFGGEVTTGDVLRGLGEYANEGGSFAFLDPTRGSFDVDPDLFGIEIPESIREIGREAEDVVRAVGSEFDDEVVQRVREGGRQIDQAVIQPIGQTLSEAETAVRRALPDIDLPEGPDIDLPDGPDINLPNVGLPQLGQGGMLGGRAGVAAPKFTPYQHQSLQFNPTIYQAPTAQKKDYVAELENLISRGMLKA